MSQAVINAESQAPQVGQLVRVRGQQWVVTQRHVSSQPRDELAATRSPGETFLTLVSVSVSVSVSDDDLGEELTLAWDIEPVRGLLPETQLPAVTDDGWANPRVFGAFLDAVPWGTVASADDRTLQAPFRSGITIEDYQLDRDPEIRALRDLHAEIDHAVLDAYGWSDLDPQIGHHPTKIGTRWTVSKTVSKEARFELLHRLLEENQRRHAGEASA